MSDNVVNLDKVSTGNSAKKPTDWVRRQKRRMRHHSRLVISLKVIFPSIAALMVGLVILWPQMQAEQEDAISLVSSAEQIDLPEQQAMINPRFFTVDEKGEPLNLQAERAFELDGKTRRIQMSKIKSDLIKQGDKWYALDAETGIYSQEDDTVELLEMVSIYAETGEEIETTQAMFDIKSRDIIGKEEVFINLPMGHVQAEGFSITKNGHFVKLTGKTRAVFYPNKKDK